MRKIPFSEPNLGSLEKQYLNEAYDSTWIGGKGDFIDRFEKKFAQYIGVKYAITCSSGTAALHLAYIACGIRDNSKVAVSNNTFISTKNMAALLTKSVSTLDEDLNTWTIKLPKESEYEFIVGVHLYGNPCDMGQAYRAKYRLIEDCAQSLGSTYRNKKCGAHGLASIFSFHSSKLITTGEGGMVCTDNSDIADQVRTLKNHSMLYPYAHQFMGFNYRMTNLQAAMGLAQLERINEFISKKRWMMDYYNSNLSSKFIPQVHQKHSFVVPWTYAYKYDGDINKLRVYLTSNGIETRPGFIDSNLILMPCSTNLNQGDLDYVIEFGNHCK